MLYKQKDRHGIADLAHDHVKPFDRIKVPPFLVYGIIFLTISALYQMRFQNKELDIVEM
jgi:hypothetical protein